MSSRERDTSRNADHGASSVAVPDADFDADAVLAPSSPSGPAEDRPAEGRPAEDAATESSADEDTSILRQSKSRARRGGRRRRRRGASPSESGPVEPGLVGSTRRWWKALLVEYGSIELENKDSVARDHLALERTFLAWLRTSLAFASIGIAVGQLFRLNTAISTRDAAAAAAAAASGDGPFVEASIEASKADAEVALRLAHLGKPLGATFLAIAVVVLLVGFHRYFEAQHWLRRGKFPASRLSIFFVTVVAAGLIVCSLVLILVSYASAPAS